MLDCEKGKVKVSLSWLAVTDDRDVVKMATKNTMEANYENHAKGLVHIFVDSVKGKVLTTSHKIYDIFFCFTRSCKC